MAAAAGIDEEGAQRQLRQGPDAFPYETAAFSSVRK